MLKIVVSNRFKNDLKLAAKHGCSLDRLSEVVDLLAQSIPLPAKFRDHNLSGEFDGFWECHIQPDWLLVYRVDGDDLALFLFRTGTHSDLFF